MEHNRAVEQTQKKERDLAFGKALRELRELQNKSQEALAFDTELDPSFISLIERGRRSPSLNTIFLLSIGLDTTPSSLVKRCEEILKDG